MNWFARSEDDWEWRNTKAGVYIGGGYGCFPCTFTCANLNVLALCVQVSIGACVDRNEQRMSASCIPYAIGTGQAPAGVLLLSVYPRICTNLNLLAFACELNRYVPGLHEGEYDKDTPMSTSYSLLVDSAFFVGVCSRLVR